MNKTDLYRLRARFGHSPKWKREEDDLLLKEWSKQVGSSIERALALTSMFPMRSPTAIYQRHRNLKS